jgi:hypothetical protein
LVDPEKGELRFSLSLSLALHAALLLAFQLTGLGRGGGGGSSREPTEVSFFSAPAWQSSPQKSSESPSESPGSSLRPSSRSRRHAVGRGLSSSTAPEGLPVPSGETRSPWMCMRDCQPMAPDPPGVDDQPSAVGETPLPGTEIAKQREGHGMKMIRYTDGGRLYSSTSGPIEGGPHLGLFGLMDLADGNVGGRPGHDACNLYRKTPSGRRTLVVLVDTSASMEGQGVACAAGAALAALDHGFEVEVVNFSTSALHQGSTRDADLILAALSTIQAQGTLLPYASQLHLSSTGTRDFVLITDTAIGNFDRVIDGYRDLLRQRADNHGWLYLVGDGEVCKKCDGPSDKHERCPCRGDVTREAMEAFQEAGFTLEATELSRLTH